MKKTAAMPAIARTDMQATTICHFQEIFFRVSPLERDSKQRLYLM